MKRNEINELKSKTVEELKRMLLDLKSELAAFKKDESIKKLKNTNSFRNKRKDVARILTFLSYKATLAPEKEVVVSGKETEKEEVNNNG